MSAERPASRVLLLGWDAADWHLIHPLLDSGRLPNLERLVTDGVTGNLAATSPTVPAMSWTTIATGVLADRHGICGPLEVNPWGDGTRCVTSTTVRAATLWRIVTGHGRRSAVVGWPATSPADAVGGTVVADVFAHPTGRDADGWPMPPDSVHPASLHATMRPLRVHPTEIDAEQLRFFLPDAPRIASATDRRPMLLASLLAACGSLHAAGTWIAEHEAWDLLAVRYDMLGHVCETFMRYCPPQMVGVSDDDVRHYGDVVERCYLFYDLMLGRYMELLGPDTTIMVVSDHGFFSGNQRPRANGRPYENSETWHRPLGILAARGPRLRRDDLVFSASVLDVAPTVLAMLDLPPARAMEGAVLTRLFTETPTVHPVEAYAVTQGQADDTDATTTADHALEELAALGYVERLPPGLSQAAQAVHVTNRMNLARVHFIREQWSKASALLTELLTLRPHHGQAMFFLARCRLHLGDVAGCRDLAAELLAYDMESPWAHLALGLIDGHEHRWEQALARFQRALHGAPTMPQVHYRIGVTLMHLERWDEAETSFRRAIDTDGHRPQTYEALGASLHRQGKHVDAAMQFATSLGLRYDQPHVHVRLAHALATSGQRVAAIASLQRALELDPTLAAAHEMLIRLRRDPDGNVGVAGGRSPS